MCIWHDTCVQAHWAHKVCDEWQVYRTIHLSAQSTKEWVLSPCGWWNVNQQNDCTCLSTLSAKTIFSKQDTRSTVFDFCNEHGTYDEQTLTFLVDLLGPWAWWNETKTSAIRLRGNVIKKCVWGNITTKIETAFSAASYAALFAPHGRCSASKKGATETVV